MMRNSLMAVALLAASAIATPVGAQWAFGVGYRALNGSESDSANYDRRGYEARAMYDRALNETFSWRAELTYTQMQFDRDEGDGPFQVSENGFEFVAAVRAEMTRGAFTGTYGTLGPVASYRAVCGVSGSVAPTGRVACDGGDVFRPGYQIGGGFRWPVSPRRDLMLEVRYVGNVTAAAGRSLLAVSAGLRGR
jgi:hypothetical protein